MRLFIVIVPSVRDGKTKCSLQLADNWIHLTKVCQKIFYQHSQPLYDVIQKTIETLKFVQSIKLRLYIIVPSVRDGKPTCSLQSANKWTLLTKVWQNWFFYQLSQPLYDVMHKTIENLKFVQSINLEFVDSLQKNGIRNLLFFDDSCEETCNSKTFIGIATAEKSYGLGTICIKHNVFHQSKLGRDVELQNTHCSLQISPWCDAGQYA